MRKRTDKDHRNFIGSLADMTTYLFSSFDAQEAEQRAGVKSAIDTLDYKRMTEQQKREFEQEYGRLAVLEEINRERAIKIGLVVLIFSVVMVSLYFIIKSSGGKR